MAKEWKPPSHYEEVSVDEYRKLAQESTFNVRTGADGKFYKVNYDSPDYKKWAEERAKKKKAKRDEKRNKLQARLDRAYERGYKEGLKGVRKVNALEKAKEAKRKAEAKVAKLEKELGA